MIEPIVREVAWGNYVRYEDYANLKSEVERLSQPAVIGGYNLSQYIRMANSETLEFDNGDIFADMTLPERIKYIVESHARLKAEVERLDTLSKQLMAQHSNISCENIMLGKAGDVMAGVIGLPVNSVQSSALIQNWNAAKEGHNMWGVVAPYVVPPCIDRYTAKEGNQSK